MKIKLEEIQEEKVKNPHLKALILGLKVGLAEGLSVSQMAPKTAQLPQEYPEGPGHTDHSDYSAHHDTAPSHGDYCD